MTKRIFIGINALLLLIIAGCGNDEEVAEELISYYNHDWITLQEMKQDKLGSSVNELTGLELESYENANVYVEEEVIPSMEEILDYLYTIEPEHSEVEELHQLQVEAEELVYEGLHELTAYYRGELDGEIIDENSEELREKYDAFNERRDDLMEKYGIVLDEDSYENGYYKMKLETDE